MIGDYHILARIGKGGFGKVRTITLKNLGLFGSPQNFWDVIGIKNNAKE